MRHWMIGAAGSLTLAFVAASALAAPKAAESDYGRNLISVSTPGRHAVAATGDCTVWVNAEGLGVGPAQLEGLHGLVLHLNTAPMAGERAASFAAGLAEMKAAFPKAPAWLVTTVEKNRAAIEARCAEDHPDPVTITAIRAADKAAK